ncbi:MAG: glycosyltransferase family 39 protein [Candidatus Daviesbacteria bacterium]|nr:glycosyltransferase family 39 protein [Candidatus Daviesbacteria bacterium]
MGNNTKALIRWKEVIIITILVRLLLFSIPLFFTPHLINLFDPWIRWDGPHYIEIAKHGYQTIGEPALFIVFYPFYPILIKAFNVLIGNYNLSAIIISWIFSIFASILLYELVLLDFNKRVALLSVWFLNIFPTAFFLQSAYTESLFLTTSLATVYFFRKGKIIQSGLAGALASMTRINGVLLLPILLTETKSVGKNLIAFILIPVGFFIYLLINYLTFKNPFYFSKVLSSHWYKHLTWPWISIQNLINFFQNQTGDYYYLFLAELITIFLLVIATILVYICVRKSYGIYMLLNLLLFTSTSFIMSTPRYTLILFPFFITLALIKNKIVLTLISTIFITLLFCLTYLYTQGRWAF